MNDFYPFWNVNVPVGRMLSSKSNKRSQSVKMKLKTVCFKSAQTRQCTKKELKKQSGVCAYAITCLTINDL
jgi:hypothetical protein